MRKLKFTFIISILLSALTSCQNCGEAVKSDTNQTIEDIMSRRSIRKYTSEKVSREVLDVIMECGINAPNGQNRQSWEIRIVDDPAIMDSIKGAMIKGHPNMKPEAVAGCFRGAPVMVFIARDLTYDFSAYDCGILAQNIMLSAWSLGVGSICLGSPVRFLTDNQECKPVLERLGFGENYELALCIGLGYADESPEAKPRDYSKVKYID